MKLKYFLLILCPATVLSLFFVRQETEVIKLAYKENQSSRLYKELLDSNRYLRYNLISLKSSPYLADRLLNEASGYELPKQSQVLSLILPQENNPAVLKEAKADWVFKLQESWPIVLVKSYVNKQALGLQDSNILLRKTNRTVGFASQEYSPSK